MKFSELSLDAALQQSISQMGFEEPSPVQAACIPVVLQGRDVIGQAQTGTGKTAAFGIPLVQFVTRDPHVQAIVLTPTRELAIQVSGELRKIAMFKKVRTLPIYGGQSIGHQIRALKQGVQIVIGTPGRVLDHLRRNTLQLGQVKFLVLDEADEMLDMGFVEEIEQIIAAIPKERQTMLFSATMPAEIKRLAQRYMKSPEHIAINKGDVSVPQINQVFYKVLESQKLESLCRIIDSEDVELGIVFCRTKKGVDELTEALQARGYLADGLHGDLSQAQRDKVMRSFRENEIEFLVATDVAARGIDVSNVTHVINYDIPQDPESYVHRIGRTGRAGRSGIAMTLVTPREMKLLHTIEYQNKLNITAREIPTFEEVAHKQLMQAKQQIREAIEELGDSRPDVYLEELLQEVSQEHAALDIARAALYIAFSDRFQPAEQSAYQFGETGAPAGMVRLFINVGRNVGLRPKELVDTIVRSIGVSRGDIGRIDIFERFTFLEVREAVAPFVMEGMKHSTIQGSRVNVEPARPRGRG